MNTDIKNGCIAEMIIHEIAAKSILRSHKKIDSWFIARYGMNLYRGCSHDCVYCDGRSERYYVEGEFGQDVAVKVNAIDILRRELNPQRKRKPFEPGYIMIGGGVGDSYQPAEEKYFLSRQALQLIDEYNFPVHILTKSTLIQRDIDIIKSINQKKRAIVSFSFSSVDEEISAIFEPGVPSPGERLQTLALFKNEGIACGMFLLPVIPMVTDSPQLIENAIQKACEIGLDFIIFGGMTLKEGRQKEYFYNALTKNYPYLAQKYDALYPGREWGEATGSYYNELHRRFYEITQKYDIPKRIPAHLFRDILNQNDFVIVILEHIDYLLKLTGERSTFGYAAYSISKCKTSLIDLKIELRKISGVNKTAEQIILEILDTGTSSYYQKLIR